MVDTALSRFVKEYGDYVMRMVTVELYSSALVRVFILLATCLCFFKLAFELHRGLAPKSALMFMIAWFCCLPVYQKPLAYTLVNGVGEALASILAKSAKNVLSGSGSKVPPGYVINSLMAAARVKVSDEQTSKRLRALFSNCIPDGPLNKRGKPITAADLFAVRYKNGKATENFDPRILKARRYSGIKTSSGADINCYRLLTTTRMALRRQLKEQVAVDVPWYAGVFKKSASERSLVDDVALNTAIGIALQNEALRNAGKHNSSIASLSLAGWLASKQSSPDILAAVAHGPSNFTKIAYDFMSTPGAIARSFGVDKALANASLLEEMNQKLLTLPYMVAAVQNLLKILAPMAILTLLLGKMVFFTTWAYAWIATMILPVLLSFSRGVSNSILMHVNKIGDYGESLSHDPGFLAHGISFEASNQMLKDSTRMMNALLNVELGVWSALFALLLGASWFSANIAGTGVAMTARSLQHQYSNRMADRAIKGVGKVAVAAVAPPPARALVGLSSLK